MCMLRPLPPAPPFTRHAVIQSTGTPSTLRLAREQPRPPLNTRPWSSLHRLLLPLPLLLPLLLPLMLPLPLPQPPLLLLLLLGPQTPVFPSQTLPARSSSRFTCGQKNRSRRSASSNRMLLSKHVFRLVLSRASSLPLSHQRCSCGAGRWLPPRKLRKSYQKSGKRCLRTITLKLFTTFPLP